MMQKFATASLLAATALAAQQETDNFVVNVQGASGGIAVWRKGGNQSDGISIKQDKIEFVNPTTNKRQGGGFNVAGQNDWSAFTEVDGVLTSSFKTVPDRDGQSFGIKVEIASTTTQVKGPAKTCDSCAGNSTGVCQLKDATCTGQTNSTCPVNTTLCTHVYNVRADAVEFTPTFTGFVFPSTDVGLTYSVQLTPPKGSEDKVAKSATKSGDSYSLSVGSGALRSAEVALLQKSAGAAATEVPVAAPAVTESAGKTTITWTFPKEVATVGKNTAVITFDPSIELGSPTPASAGSYVLPSVLTTLGALLALY